MRFFRAALVTLVLAALVAPTIGSADTSAGGRLAGAAKKCKGKKGKASAAKGKKCKGAKKPGGQAPGGQKPGAGAPPPPDPTGNTVITLNSYLGFTPGNEQIQGTVTSNNAACTNGRTLSLYEELGAVDQLRDTSLVVSGTLFFDFPIQTSGDDFYAVATQNTVGNVACGPATSNLISKP